MSESKQSPALPSVIAGRYQVIRQLGAGAFGTVYKAKDSRLSRELAIKTIRLEGLAAASVGLPELLQRFKQEAMAGAKLKHPNIVTIYDYGESEGQAYLAMEFVDGVGLDRLIKEADRLPEERAASIAAQVADALGYAHEHNVVHRDIKPANIMIEPGERVKLTDLGVARLTDSVESLTATGGVIGTPSYMSPEQARGQKVDGRSDLFSVGCVLYELLAGRKAFTGDNITGIIFKIITEEPPSLRELAPFVSDEMVRVVQKSVAKDPARRYQTGQEFAADLFALAQPGHDPTVRQKDVATVGGSAPGEVPTIASAPTAPGSLSSSPTSARPVPPVPGAPTPGAPPVAATQLLGDAGSAAPPPLPPAATPRRPTPALPRPAARAPQRGGAGKAIAIAAGAALLLLVGAVGAWMLLGRGDPPSATVADSGVEPAAPPGTPPADAAPATPDPAPTTPEAAPVTAPAGTPVPAAPRSARAGAMTAAPPPAPVRRAPAAQQGGGSGSEEGGREVATGTEAAAATAPVPPPPRGDDVFLDELPQAQATDGRAAGQALAQAYGSGNAPAYGSASRFNRRPRIPRDTRPAEQPAVRALAWILSAQRSYFKRSGRYGTLGELVESGDLPLTGPRTADSFDRRQYRITVAAAGESFRADARPLSPRGRPFFVDDNGFVLKDE